MKTGSFTPKPGDLFQWHYDDNECACRYDPMWSDLMKEWIPLNSGNLQLLISITKDEISWLNGENFQYARTIETDVMRKPPGYAPAIAGERRSVHPRKY